MQTNYSSRGMGLEIYIIKPMNSIAFNERSSEMTPIQVVKYTTLPVVQRRTEAYFLRHRQYDYNGVKRKIYRF